MPSSRYQQTDMEGRSCLLQAQVDSHAPHDFSAGHPLVVNERPLSGGGEAAFDVRHVGGSRPAQDIQRGRYERRLSLKPAIRLSRRHLAVQRTISAAKASIILRPKAVIRMIHGPRPKRVHCGTGLIRLGPLSAHVGIAAPTAPREWPHAKVRQSKGCDLRKHLFRIEGVPFPRCLLLPLSY